MIAVFNRLPVKEGAAGQVAGMFADSRGNVQGFPGFASMEVVRSEGEDEVFGHALAEPGSLRHLGRERGVLYTIRTSSAPPYGYDGAVEIGHGYSMVRAIRLCGPFDSRQL